MSLLQIDGRRGEGGGQVLRTSLSLAALTGRSVQLTHIRAGRRRPGLRPQHLTAARALAAICGARLSDDRLESQSLTFEPMHPPVGGNYSFDVSDVSRFPSAGAVTLIWQALLWPLCFASESSNVTLRGGTFVPFSPPYHYMAAVATLAFSQMGVRLRSHLAAWGWMERGQGQVNFQLEPLTALQPLVWTEPAQPISIPVQGIAAVTNLAAHIPQRMANRAANLLHQAGYDSSIAVVREKGHGPGAGIMLWLALPGRLGAGSALGRRGVPADKVADNAVAQLLAFVDNRATVDQHLADQLLLPMALSAGISQFTTNALTLHTLTQVDLLRDWLGVHIEIDGERDRPGRVTVHGIGFSRRLAP